MERCKAVSACCNYLDYDGLIYDDTGDLMGASAYFVHAFHCFKRREAGQAAGHW
jgi:hypothetical protein